MEESLKAHQHVHVVHILSELGTSSAAIALIYFKICVYSTRWGEEVDIHCQEMTIRVKRMPFLILEMDTGIDNRAMVGLDIRNAHGVGKKHVLPEW